MITCHLYNVKIIKFHNLYIYIYFLIVSVKIIDWGEEVPRTKDKIESLRVAFKQEVSLWHNLNHPNITKVIKTLASS